MKSHITRSGSDAWEDSCVRTVLMGLGVAADRLDAMRSAEHAGLWEACVDAGLVTHDEVLAAYRSRFGVPVADIDAADPTEAAAHLPEEAARQLRVLPLRIEGRTLVAATPRPLNLDLEQSLGFACGLRPKLVLTDPATLERGLARAYPAHQGADVLVDSVGRLDPGEGLLREVAEMDDEAAQDVSTSDLVDAILVRAIRQRASDVHIQPHDGSIAIRYRIDGAIMEIARLPRSLLAPVTSRLKILANLDIADRMRPQDGRAQVQLGGRRVDLRISTLPVGALGEKTVVRILDGGAKPLTLKDLGFFPDELKRAEQLFRASEGLVLVTGPTGSGKTTTLYSALRLIQSSGVNIVTVEDPIEYRLDGVAQAQVNEKAGLTFATVLRSILRQDPDAVLVGEIRDLETAQVALQASMTGHIVLSTLHTNDAPSTIMRLTDMDVDMTVLSSSLRGVVAQRLVRRVCPACRAACDVSSLADSQRALLADLPVRTVYTAVGCAECSGLGYRGRLVVPEIVVVTPELEHAITQGEDFQSIVQRCRRGGMISLWESGLRRVAEGLTTLNELLDNISPPVTELAATTAQADVDAIFRSVASPEIGQTGLPRPGADAARATSIRRLRMGPGRVLIVDEDPHTRAMVRKVLERDGFTVNEAADGETALEYVARLKPDVMLLELTLPRLDGTALLRSLRDQVDCGTIPVVLTVQSDPEIAVWAMELGAVDVLTKPFDPDLLSRRLMALPPAAAA